MGLGVKKIETIVKRIIRRIIKKYYRFTFWDDGMATVHNFNFIYDKRFLEAYKISGETDIGMGFRVYNYCWAAKQASHLDGDYVECGVKEAMFSRAMTHYVEFEKLVDKKLYLLDTYDGLIKEQITDKEHFYSYPSVYEEVKEYFKKYPNVEIIKGLVPDTLSQIKSNKICYLSIDMNCAYPEVKTLEGLWDKMVSGGIIILDDYAYKGHQVQMKAIDKFIKNKGVKVLNLTCGQGMIIKP